jgi:hypothetical protein
MPELKIVNVEFLLNATNRLHLESYGYVFSLGILSKN